MPLALLTEREFTIPSAADGIVLTTTGGAWTNSAFVELLSSISGASILSGFLLTPGAALSGTFDNQLEVDIATGGAGSEVVISTFRFAYANFLTTGGSSGSNLALTLPIGIDNIANNARISARIRCSAASVFTFAVSLQYFSKPVSANYLTTAQPYVAIPPAANSIAITSGGSSWQNGAYVQLRTNSGAALILVGIVLGWVDSTVGIFEIDIATGAAASEVVITTIRFRGTFNSLPGYYLLPNSLDNIAINTRIAARIRGTAVNILKVALNVIEKPL